MVGIQNTRPGTLPRLEIKQLVVMTQLNQGRWEIVNESGQMGETVSLMCPLIGNGCEDGKSVTTRLHLQSCELPPFLAMST